MALVGNDPDGKLDKILGRGSNPANPPKPVKGGLASNPHPEGKPRWRSAQCAAGKAASPPPT